MPQRHPWWFWLVLGALAALAVFWRITEPYAGSIVSSDEAGYVALAGNLAAGRGFTESTPDNSVPYQSPRTAWRAPLFPVWLALFYGAAPDDLTAAHWARRGQAVLGGIAVWLLGCLAWRVWPSRAAALAAAALLARDGASLDLAKLQITEPLFVALLLAALLVLERALDTRRPAVFAVGGTLVGLALLTRPVSLALAAALLAVLAARSTTPAGRRRLAAFAVALAVVVGPWVVRNTWVNGRPTGITSNAGFNLYLDNSGRPHREVWTELYAATTGTTVHEAAQDAGYRRRAQALMAADPRGFAGHVGRRLGRMALEPFWLTILALAGLGVATWRRPRANLAPLLAVATLAATYAVVLYDERMAVTLMPFRYLYAMVAPAWGVEQAWAAAAQGRERRAAIRS